MADNNLGFDLPSIPDFFNLEEKVSFLHNILPSFMEQGYSATASLGILRENGFSIGNQRFYFEWRYIEGTEQAYNQVRYMSQSYEITPDILGVYNKSMQNDYRFIFRYSTVDENTGKKVYSYFGLETNNLMTVGELNDLGAEYFSDLYPGVDNELISIQVWKGFKRQ